MMKDTKDMKDTKKVGLIGLGLMGRGAAKNILAKGFPLAVLGHRNRAPVGELLAQGATEAGSAAELARSSDVVILFVPGSPQVEEQVFGANGLLAGMHEGLVVIDCTTADPESTLKVAQAVSERGGRFMDAPVNRGPKEAEEGRLVVMAGADERLLAEMRPILSTFAEAIFHLGPVGAGHKAKLIHNFLCLGNAAVIAEGITTAAKVGVDLHRFAEFAMLSGAASRMFERLIPYVLEGDDKWQQFAIRNAQKDLRYYTHMTESAPTTAFVAEAAHQMLILAANMGRGDEYVPHLFDVLEEINDVEVRVRQRICPETVSSTKCNGPS